MCAICNCCTHLVHNDNDSDGSGCCGSSEWLLHAADWHNCKPFFQRHRGAFQELKAFCPGSAAHLHFRTILVRTRSRAAVACFGKHELIYKHGRPTRRPIQFTAV
jgi:hypothetical protein